MGHFASKVGLAAVISISASAVNAVIVSDTNITFGVKPDPDEFGTHWARVRKGVDGTWTAVTFAYTGTSLQLCLTTLDEGSDWYLVGEGLPFTTSTIAAGQFVSIHSVFESYPPVTIPQGNFYLGVVTGAIQSSEEVMPRDVFGWIRLDNSSVSLEAMGNAVAYGEGGIVVGTTTAVPEAGTCAVASAGTLLILQRRRRN